jgi:hypothetical protein
MHEQTILPRRSGYTVAVEPTEVEALPPYVDPKCATRVIEREANLA